MRGLLVRLHLDFVVSVEVEAAPLGCCPMASPPGAVATRGAAALGPCPCNLACWVGWPRPLLSRRSWTRRDGLIMATWSQAPLPRKLVEQSRPLRPSSLGEAGWASLSGETAGGSRQKRFCLSGATAGDSRWGGAGCYMSVCVQHPATQPAGWAALSSAAQASWVSG